MSTSFGRVFSLHLSLDAQGDAIGEEKSVTIGRYVREISVKARNMLGRPQAGARGASWRPSSSAHASHEQDAREDQKWGARDVVSLIIVATAGALRISRRAPN